MDLNSTRIVRAAYHRKIASRDHKFQPACCYNIENKFDEGKKQLFTSKTVHSPLIEALIFDIKKIEEEAMQSCARHSCGRSRHRTL